MHSFYREMRTVRSYLALVSSETESFAERFAGLLAVLFWHLGKKVAIIFVDVESVEMQVALHSLCERFSFHKNV